MTIEPIGDIGSLDLTVAEPTDNPSRAQMLALEGHAPAVVTREAQVSGSLGQAYVFTAGGTL